MTVMGEEDEEYTPPGAAEMRTAAAAAFNGSEAATAAMNGGQDRKRKKPDFSMEWKDLKIEIKVYGKDIDEEDQQYLELFPNMSQDILSSQCIEEKKETRRNRPSSTLGHTLTDLLEQSTRESFDEDDEEGGEASSSRSQSPRAKIQKTTSSDGIDDMYNIKHLILLPSGDRKCHICGKVFPELPADDPRSSALKQQLRRRIKRHLMAHSGKKPFECNLCGWGFFQKCNLDRHMSSHSKEGEGEQCPHCKCWFTTKSVLSLHMRERHNDRLVTKKELEMNMNRIKRELDEKKKQAEREENLRKIRALNERRLEIQKQQQEAMAAAGGSLQVHNASIAAANNKVAGFMQHSIFQSSIGEEATREEIARSNNKCNICNKTFVKKTNLKHHLMLHRGEKPWKCSLCEWRFVQKCNLKKHMQSHVDGLFACPVCSIKFSSKGSVSTHLYRAHKDSLPESYLQTEEEIPPPPGQSNLLSGPKSPGSTWWKQLENQELSRAGASQQRPMPSLQAALKAPPQLKKLSPRPNPVGSTVPPGTPPVACHRCGKMFVTAAHLAKHMLVHNAGVKPYACPVCGCRFHLQHNLKRHIMNHEQQGDIEEGTSDKLIRAAEAKTAQAAAVTLQQKTGLLTRTGPMQRSGVMVDNKGNMKCNMCNLWFHSAAEMGAHMKLHDGEQPHVCTVCGWRFKQIQNLRRHMHTHTGIKPFTCDFCEKGYTDAYTLKMHIQKSHPGVASSLPSLQVPRAKQFPSEEAGFQNMIAQMKSKDDAIKAYQAQFQVQQGEDDLVLEPDINMFSPDEDLIEQDGDMSNIEAPGNTTTESTTKKNIEENKTIEKNDIQDILDMDDEDDEIVEEIEQDQPTTEARTIENVPIIKASTEKETVEKAPIGNTPTKPVEHEADTSKTDLEESIDEDINISAEIEDLGEEDDFEIVTEIEEEPEVAGVDDEMPIIDTVAGDVSMDDIQVDSENIDEQIGNIVEDQNKSADSDLNISANNDLNKSADSAVNSIGPDDVDFEAQLQMLEAQVTEETEKSEEIEKSVDSNVDTEKSTNDKDEKSTNDKVEEVIENVDTVESVEEKEGNSEILEKVQEATEEKKD